MYLKKIELQGFKSFANKTELLFNKNLTSIVGPNGSGKSNIADAIRWATGEQSQKILRTKKAEEVIFAGSDKKGRLGMAEVSLHLDNSDKKIPLDFQEVVITRRVYRNGESEYIINKSKVRLTDIQLLLAKASFGQHNYSIIGQGMIDSVLSQSANSRKSFFDEATGVKAQQIKKEKAQHKYIGTQENLSQSKNILNEISPRLKYLTRQVNKLAKQQELEEKLKKLQNNYYGFLVSNIKKEIDQTQSILSEKESLKNKLEIELKKIQDELNREETKNSYSDEYNKIQEEYNNLINQKNKLIRNRIVYETKLDAKFSTTGKNNLSWLTEQQNDFRQEKNDNQNKLTKIKENLIKINEDLEDKKQKQNEFIKKINTLQEKLQKYDENNFKFSDKEIKNKVNSLNSKIQKTIQNIDNIEYSELKKEIYFISKEIQAIYKYINQENNEDKRNFQELQKKFQKYLLTKDSYVNEIYELKNQKNLLEIKLQNLNKRQIEINNKLEKIKQDVQIAKSNNKEKEDLEIKKVINNLNTKIEELDKKIRNTQEKIDKLNKQNEENRKSLFEMQRKARTIQEDLNEKNNLIQSLNIKLTKHQTHYEDLIKEMEYEKIKTNELNYQIENINKDELFNEINKYKKQLNQIGGIEESIEDEFNEVKTKYEFLEKQITDLEKASQNLKRIIDDLNNKIDNQFYKNFKKINDTFNKYFQILFNGGYASLSIQKEKIQKNLNNTEDNNNEEIKNKNIYNGQKEIISDILISVKLPGKKQSNMTFLSGGEKALTSIALICAIIYHNPSPFVVLDEVDAALDEANSERFAEIIDNLKTKTQFICITHNRATMHKAERIYGVTIDNSGVSKLLSISFNQAEKYSD